MEGIQGVDRDDNFSKVLKHQSPQINKYKVVENEARKQEKDFYYQEKLLLE